MDRSFPDDFLFGAATASFQVEGAGKIDGRGASIWDTFCEQPGRVLGDDNGEVAVDQYHRYGEDAALMLDLGVGAYRFSISWPRVLPDGRGAVNEKGLDYYDRLVDALLERGIQPWATLFHWDLPQELQDVYGGWADRRIVDDFAAYATVIGGRLSDRVKHFFTINEFFCFIDKGYGMGKVFDAFAPGLKLSRKELAQTRHHAVLAHGAAVQALRTAAKGPISVGLADNPNVCCPLIETPANIEAAKKAFRQLHAPYLTAVMEGAYHPAYLKELGADAPTFTDEDMKLIATPLDFLGCNMYAPQYVEAADNDDGFRLVPVSPAHPKFEFDWLRFGPEITYWGPRLAKELWGVENFYITENGCSTPDGPDFDGAVSDTGRVAYLRAHFQSAARAVAEGWPLKGYFVWSLLDNFEWAHGYARRFGLIYVNYTTLARTPKLSYHWYRELIRARRLV